MLQRKWKSLQCSAQATGPGESVKVRTSAVSAEIKQVKARRKTARMLMVVLFVFALCYLPISVLNIMKRYSAPKPKDFRPDKPTRHLSPCSLQYQSKAGTHLLINPDYPL